MAVNKNFVVKNVLEVNENLIVDNIDDNAVGVGTSTPNYQLHVFGGIGATDVRVTGVSSFIQSIYVGSAGTTFAVVDTSGSNAQVGIGTDLPAYMLDIRSAVSTGQTALYVKGDARITGDLIADDIVLDQADFTNINVTGFTTTRELVVGYGASVAGITTIGYLSRAAAGSGGTSLTFNPAVGIATNFQVIGNTYLEGGLKIKNDLDVDTNLFIVGIVTAGTVHVGTALTVAGISTFMSDVYVGGNVATGLQIAGVTTLASAGGITTTGGDFWVGNNFYVAGTQTIDSDLYIIGIATVGILTVTTDANVGGAVTIGGDLTVGGDLNVSGDLSYDEVTGRNLNITGIATIHTLGVTSTTTTQDLAVGGASTLTGYVSLGATVGTAGSIYLPNTKSIRFGDTAGGDLWIYHYGTDDYIRGGAGKFWLQSDEVTIKGQAGVETSAVFTKDGPVRLYYDNSQKFYTTNTGVVISGISTADYFIGDGSNLTGIAASLVAGIGIGSESTPIGSGVTFLNVVSSTGAAIAMDPPTSGIATVTITPGASLGMVLALGG